jgi:hypothetical protein
VNILDIYQMTGSPEDEIAILEEINLRLAAGANELLAENARMRAALAEISRYVHLVLSSERWRPANVADVATLDHIRWLADYAPKEATC